MADEKPDERRLNIRVDVDTHRKLRLRAAEEDKSIQQLVEELLNRALGTPEEGRKGGVCLA